MTQLDGADLAPDEQRAMAETLLTSRSKGALEAARAETAAAQTLGIQNGGLRRMLRRIAFFWLGFISLLAAMDSIFLRQHPELPPLSPPYYLVLAGSALALLILASARGAQQRLGRHFLPLAIGCLSWVPLSLLLLVPHPRVGPISGTPGLMSLRMAPILMVALALVAWRYRWRDVLLFTAGTGLLMLAGLVLRGTASGISLAVVTMQSFGMLFFGYFFCALMERLREQRASVERANTQLLHHASTLESLTISRERNRMARELHDTLAHTLSALSVQLETTKAYWQVDPDASRALLETALEATRDGLRETRRALKALRASPLDDLGLRLALQDVAQSAAAAGDLRLDLSIQEELPLLPPDVEQCIYRVAQEALTNVVHHAAARHMVVELRHDGKELLLTIRDDGCGFNPDQSSGPGHFGLAGMRERAQLAGGALAVASAPGKGTTIHLGIRQEA